MINVNEFLDLLQHPKFDIQKIKDIDSPMLWVYYKVSNRRYCVKKYPSDFDFSYYEIIDLLDDDDIELVKLSFDSNIIKYIKLFFQREFNKSVFFFAEEKPHYLIEPFYNSISLTYKIHNHNKNILMKLHKEMSFDAYHCENTNSMVLNIHNKIENLNKKLSLMGFLNKDDVQQVILYYDYLSPHLLNNTKRHWIKGINDICSIFYKFKYVNIIE